MLCLSVFNVPMTSFKCQNRNRNDDECVKHYFDCEFKEPSSTCVNTIQIWIFGQDELIVQNTIIMHVQLCKCSNYRPDTNWSLILMQYSHLLLSGCKYVWSGILQSNTTSRANTQISTATATSFRGQLIDEEMKNKYMKKTLLSTHVVLNKPVTGNVWCLSYYSM